MPKNIALAIVDIEYQIGLEMDVLINSKDFKCEVVKTSYPKK